MRKRILSLGLSLAMLLSLLPGTALAAGTEDEQVTFAVVESESYSAEFTTAASVPSPMAVNTLAETDHFTTFGDQLQSNTYATTIYEALSDPDNLDKIRRGEAVSVTLETKTFSESETTQISDFVNQDVGTMFSAARDAAAAFDRDHSNIFWTSGISSKSFKTQDGSRLEGSYYPTAGTYTVGLDITLPLSVSWSGESSRSITDDESAVNSAIQTIISSIPESDSTYTKLEKVHDWLTENNAYNSAAAATGSGTDSTPWTALSALSNDDGLQPVCEGYARAFKLICDELEIPCVLVSGLGKTTAKPDGEAHMWNYVQMEDGRWYAVDVTWDDPTGGSTGNVSGNERDTYFLVGGNTEVDGTTTFNSNHIAQSNNFLQDGNFEFSYPLLSSNKYTPKTPITGNVSITGDAKIDSELTATPSGTPADVTLKYQWYRGDEAISGAISNTYTPTTAADVGQTIKVVVTADGYSGQLVASTTAPVAKGDATSSAVTPTNYTATHDNITVTTEVGHEYACVQGDGQPSTWQDSGSFSGLTASTTYKIYARVKETATHNASAASTPLTVTTKAAPIQAVTVTVDTPAKGVELDTTADISVPASGVTATTMEWYKGTVAEGEPVTGPADANQVYTVKITLTAGADQSFAGTVTAEGYDVQRTSDTQIILTKTFPATAEKSVTKIEVTTQPTKTEYAEGDKFDPTGMVVTATYDDNSTAPVTGYTVSPETLTADTTGVTVTYAGKTATVSGIKVLKKPTAADFDITLPADATYDGTSKTATITAKSAISGMGNVTIRYNGNTTAPTDAGTYQVTFDVAKGANYAAATGLVAGTFTIAKANQDALTITSTGPATYGETYTLTTTGGSTNGTVTYSVTNGTGSATISGSTLTPTKAGEVTVTATMEGNTNYEPVTSAPVTITINKAEATQAMKTATSTIVAGKSSSVTLPALPDGASYGEPSTTSTSEVTGPAIANGALTYTGGESVVTGTEYIVTIPVGESTNYNAYDITVTLTGSDKLTPTLTVNPITVTYNGKSVPASAITGTAKVGDTVVSGTWNWGSAVVSPTKVSDSGTYDVFFTPTDSATYAVAFGKVQVTINKATPTGTPTYTPITTSGKTLGDANLQIGSITPGGGQITWVEGNDRAVLANIAYYWTYTPTDTANYNNLTGSITPWVQSTNPGGGGSSGGGSSSGGSSSSGDKTETTKNPDGSTTTTVTKPDGTVTTTNTDKSGNKTQTVEKPDGTTTTTVDKKDGSSSTTTVSASGAVEATVDLSESAVVSAASQGQPVALPMPEVPVTSRRSSAPTVTVNLPVGGTAQVEIPVEDVTSGTVAILVKADGSEQIIKTSLTTDNGVAVTLKDGDTVKIVDNSKTFYDVPGAYWGADAIDFATSREIFSGTSGTTFSPETPMNRAMIVTVLAAYQGVDTTAGSTWYEAGRQWAMEQGISDGTNMDQTLTREQLATMLWRYAGSPSAGSLSGYPDASSVSGYASQAMAWAVENGLISGMDGNLAPQGQATRAQVATILMRFVENQNA